MTDLHLLDASDSLDEEFATPSKDYLSLNDFEKLDWSDESGFCMTYSVLADANSHRAKKGLPLLKHDYFHWEENVASPFFVREGYTVGKWFDGEWDSFGPLSRQVKLTKDGKETIFVYG